MLTGPGAPDNGHRAGSEDDAANLYKSCRSVSVAPCGDLTGQPALRVLSSEALLCVLDGSQNSPTQAPAFIIWSSRGRFKGSIQRQPR
jgi:hypothetical protein